MRRLRQLSILLPALLVSLPVWADPAVISVTDATLVEGSAGLTDMLFTVRVDGDLYGEASVAYAVSPCTATPGDDYVDVNGFLTFSSASTSDTVAVPIRGDEDVEGTESLFLHLSDAVGAVIGRGRALGRILNDDVQVPAPRPRGDQDGDGRSDLVVWYERMVNGNPPGTVINWGLNGQVATLLTIPPEFPAGDWTVAATADVDADGLPELIWHHPKDGLAFSAYAQGEGFSEPEFDAPELLPAGTPPTAEIVGAGDFSDDGEADLLTWDPVSGALSIWVLKGEAIIGTETPEPAAADPGWRPEAVGDFDGDGSPDILWLHDASRQLRVWRMYGTKALEIVPFEPATAPASSQVVAIGDFDGDGDEDLVWQESSQELFMWLLEDGELVCADDLVPSTLQLSGWATWEVVGPR